METARDITTGGQERLIGLLAALLLTLLAFSVALVPIRADNDCWWHVKTGQYIAQHGLPTHDVFSYTAADHEWHNHEWLTQWLMWKVWEKGDGARLGGWRAVILSKSLVLWLCYLCLLLLARRISGSWAIALLVTVMAIDAGRRTFYPRPPVVSNLLLACELMLLIGARQRWWSRWWLAALPPLFALWANLHGAWMAGLVVLGAFFVDDAVTSHPRAQRFLERAPGALPLRAWGALLAGCMLATLANPFGYKLYLLPSRVLSDRDLVASISELQPPNWRFMAVLIATLALTAAALLVLAVRSWQARRLLVPMRLAEWGIYAFFLHQGVNHVRHLLLFSVMMVPLAALLFGAVRRELLGTEEQRPRRLRWIEGTFFALALLFAAATLRTWPEGQTYPFRNRLYAAIPEGYIRANYPADACDFVELVGFEGRMFNENSYAGYLVWRLSPEKHLVFSDPRFDIFGGAIWREELIAATGFEPEPGEDIASWREVLDRWQVNWLLIRHDSGLARRLSNQEQGWVLVADWTRHPRQGPWHIWVRDSPENAALIARARRIFDADAGRIAP